MADDKPHADRRIGSLNGPWSILLRLALASYPLVLAWAVWMTTTQFEDLAFRTSGERFTASDGLRLRAELVDLISNAPSQDWKDRIQSIEENQVRLLQAMARVEARIEGNPNRGNGL